MKGVDVESVIERGSLAFRDDRQAGFGAAGEPALDRPGVGEALLPELRRHPGGQAVVESGAIGEDPAPRYLADVAEHRRQTAGPLDAQIALDPFAGAGMRGAPPGVEHGDVLALFQPAAGLRGGHFEGFGHRDCFQSCGSRPFILENVRVLQITFPG